MELISVNDMLFDRYEIKRPLQPGGQGFTFIARDHQCLPDQPWARDVFIKQYHDLPANRELLATMDQTVRLMRDELKDARQYICLPQETGITHHTIVFVFPFVQGQGLSDWLTDPNLDEARQLRFSLAVTKAVQCLHEVGMIHLDLKPDNVMIQHRNGEDYVQLIDLDAAKINGVGLRPKVMGTPGYYSPEHIAPDRFGDVCEQSDVFSLAILLCELLFGSHPFAHTDNYARAIIGEDYQLPEGVSKPLCETLKRCLCADRNRRPQTKKLSYELFRFRESGAPLPALEEALPISAAPVAPVAPKPAIQAKPLPRLPASLPAAESKPAAKPRSKIPASSFSRIQVRFESPRSGRGFSIRQHSMIGQKEFRISGMRPDHLHVEVRDKDACIQLCGQSFWDSIFGPRIWVNGRKLDAGMRVSLKHNDKIQINLQVFQIKIESQNSS